MEALAVAEAEPIAAEELYKPEWKGPIEGWAVNYITAQLWRVQPRYDFDDLLQDAYVYFMVCVERYKVKEGKHFMALFKTCLRNHVYDLAMARSRSLEVSDVSDEFSLMDFVGDSSFDVERWDLRETLAAAPQELQKAIAALTAEDKPKHIRVKGHRETTNEYIYRITGWVADELKAAILALLRGKDALCIR